MKYNDIKIRCNCKILPPKGYSAITLFGTIYTRKSEKEVEEYLKTCKGQQWINHERIHMLQHDDMNSWILFYLLYFYYFIIAWLWFMKWKDAYHTIPFEIEAYQNQLDSCYPYSRWRNYIKNIKERKETL